MGADPLSAYLQSLWSLYYLARCADQILIHERRRFSQRAYGSTCLDVPKCFNSDDSMKLIHPPTKNEVRFT